MDRNVAHVWDQNGNVKADIELPIPPDAIVDGRTTTAPNLPPEVSALRVDKKVKKKINSSIVILF